MIARQPRDHSATVDLRLRVNGRILDVGQVGHKFLILAEPCELPPGTEGELIVTVDGKETVQRVILHDGARSDSAMVGFR
ncbi:MAG TPA: hypothetical protein VMP01_04630 [Pirellulaceae bacterium]|nr:hypothetical protein [Pirellulaceae bacterium]